MPNDINPNAPKPAIPTLEYNKQQSALDAGLKGRDAGERLRAGEQNDSMQGTLKRDIPTPPKGKDVTADGNAKPAEGKGTPALGGDKEKTGYEKQEQENNEKLKNIDAARQKLVEDSKKLDAEEKELKAKQELQAKEGKERSVEARKAIAEIAKSIPEGRNNLHTDTLKKALKDLPDKLTEADVKEAIKNARWDAAKANVGAKEWGNMTPEEKDLAQERFKKLEESATPDSESAQWGAAKKSINLPPNTKWEDMTSREQKVVQKRVAEAKEQSAKDAAAKDPKKTETPSAAPASAPKDPTAKDPKKTETPSAAPASAPKDPTAKDAKKPDAPADNTKKPEPAKDAPTKDVPKPAAEKFIIPPPLPKDKSGSSADSRSWVEKTNEDLAHGYNLGVRGKIEPLFDSVKLKKGGPGIEHITDGSRNVNMKVSEDGETRVAYISPKSDKPQIESGKFIDRNVANYRNKIDWIRNSTNDDHTNLTRNMSPGNLTPLFGDSKLTNEFSAQRNQKMSGAMSGDYTERPGAMDIKDLARARASLYSSADGQHFITELGNSAKIRKDGAMDLFGMRFGVPMYDSKRMQETGHSGTSTVHVDQDFKVNGTTVIPKDHYLQLDTGKIYDKSGNWVGEFEPDGKVFNAGLKVFISPKSYQQKAQQNAALL